MVLKHKNKRQGNNMKTVKKIIAATLVASLVNLFAFSSVGAGDKSLLAAAWQNNKTATKVTEHKPQTHTNKEGDMPDERSWLSKYKWWVILGIAAVAGGAAAAAGGGDDDGGGGVDIADATVTW